MTKKDLKEIIDPKHYQEVVPGFQYIHTMEYILRPRLELLRVLREEYGVPEELLKEIDSLPMVGHLRGQAFKYQMRSGKKDPVLQENKKAAWYLNYLNEYLERKDLNG
jgi:hypothetical protein